MKSDRHIRYLTRGIKKETNDSIKYRKMYLSIQNDLKYYKDYSFCSYYCNSDLMNQINNLTMVKQE